MSLSLLPENMTNNYVFDVKGVGIYLYHSLLNIYGGKICINKGINNTDIYSNKNSQILIIQTYMVYVNVVVELQYLKTLILKLIYIKGKYQIILQ